VKFAWNGCNQITLSKRDSEPGLAGGLCINGRKGRNCSVDGSVMYVGEGLTAEVIGAIGDYYFKLQNL